MVFVLQLHPELICRLANVGGPNDLTVQVGEWLPNHGSNDDQGNQYSAVETSIDQEWKNIVEEQNESNDAIEYRYTSLGDQ